MLTLAMILYAGWPQGTMPGAVVLFLILAAADTYLTFVLMAWTFAAVQFSHRGIMPSWANASLIYYLAMLASVTIFVWQKRVLRRNAPAPIQDSSLTRYSLLLKFLLLLAAIMLLTFKGFSPLLTAINLVLLAWTFWSIPLPAKPWTQSLRTSLATTGLCILSIILSAAIVEIGCRLFVNCPPAATGLYDPDPDYIFLLKPGAQVTYSVPLSPAKTSDIAYDISRQGFRDREYGPKSPDEFRVLLLGDSVTMGHAVPLEATISRQLEDLLAKERIAKRITIINGGMNGAGPLQERGMLLKRGLALNPDLVILQCFLINDIDDCMNSVGKSLRAYASTGHKIVNILRRQSELPCRIDRWVTEHSKAYATAMYLMGTQGMIAEFLSECRFFPPFPQLDLTAPDEGAPSLDVNRLEMYPELSEGWSLFEAYMRIIANDCRKRGIDFAVYCIPSHEEISRELWDTMSKGRGGSQQFERFLAIRKAMNFLAQEDIRNIYIVDALLHYEYRITEIFYPVNGHPTPAGNHVIAKCLRDYLTLEYFPSKGLMH